jgi:hypothetical protein
MWRGLKVFASVLNVSAIFVVGFLVWNSGWQPSIGASKIEYKDFISIILTSLALMIALLGVVLAGFAFYGFEVIKKGAHRIAAMEARRVAKEVAHAEARIISPSVAARAAEEYLEQMQAGLGGDYGEAAAKDDNK